MKTFVLTTAAAAFLLLFSSCASKPVAASEWNQLKIWSKVGERPPTYVPANYGASLPRTEREGVWFEDKRDGKRLFVPNHVSGQWSHEVLIGEAKKITAYKAPKPPKSAGDVVEGIGSVLIAPFSPLFNGGLSSLGLGR